MAQRKETPSFSSQNETNTTVTSQGRSDERQQENRRNQIAWQQRKNIYSPHFLCYYRLETARFCFVFLQTFLPSWSQIWLPFFFCFFHLEKCILALQPCISVLAYPWVFYFDCQYLKHYSMTLLCSKTDFILSSSPTLKILCFVFVFNFLVIRNNIPAV